MDPLIEAARDQILETLRDALQDARAALLNKSLTDAEREVSARRVEGALAMLNFHKPQ